MTIKDFWIRLRFDDQKLNSALVESLISIKASQSALAALLVEHISNCSEKRPEELEAVYSQMVDEFKLKYLVDLEMDYSESTQMEKAKE